MLWSKDQSICRRQVELPMGGILTINPQGLSAKGPPLHLSSLPEAQSWALKTLMDLLGVPEQGPCPLWATQSTYAWQYSLGLCLVGF